MPVKAFASRVECLGAGHAAVDCLVEEGLQVEVFELI